MKHRLGPLQYITVGIITLIWIGASSLFAAIFVTDYPRYAAAGYASAVLTGLVIGLLHLGWLALFRSPAACWGLIIAKLCAVPITIGAGFMSIAMGAMGADAGVENAAQQIGFLLPFCMAIASIPTTLGALLGAVIGHFVGKSRAKASAGAPGAPPPPPWQNDPGKPG